MSYDHAAQMVYKDLLRKFPNNFVKQVITVPWKAFHHLSYDPLILRPTPLPANIDLVFRKHPQHTTLRHLMLLLLSAIHKAYSLILQILSVIFSGSSSLISLFKAVLHHLSSLPNHQEHLPTLFPLVLFFLMILKSF